MANKTLAFEIGTEELPAFDLHAATEKLGGLAAAALDGAKIPHGSIAVYSTPRRLIVVVADVPEATEAAVEEYRGPAAKIAFDENGQPTKAAIGFARGKGVDPASLERRDENVRRQGNAFARRRRAPSRVAGQSHHGNPMA